MMQWRTLFRLFTGSLAVLAAVAALGTTEPSPVAAQSSATVDIVDFAFVSPSVTIEAGGSVTWVNSGAAPHSATGTGGSFDTGIIDPGGSATITFDTPGTYSYFCTVHPAMTGTITVVAANDGGGDGGGGDDGGDDDPVTQLPDTGIGIAAGSGSTRALALGLLAGALMAGSFAVRTRSR